MEKKLDTIVNIRISTEQLKKVDKLADKLQIKRAQMLRNLVDIGLDSANFMNVFGVFNIVGFLRENEIKPGDLLQLAGEIV